MNILKLVIVIGFSSLTVACANRLESVDRNPPAIGEFQQALHKGYIVLARAEYEEYDRFDGYEYVRRAAVLADGGEILPEDVASRNLPADRIHTFTSARARLMKAIRSDAIDRNPLALASAQLNFDCWIQEQEENNQEDEILACQEGFITTIEQAEYRAPPKTQTEQISPVISNITSIERSTVGDNARSIEDGHIYFEYNEAALTSEAINQISKIVADLKALEVEQIILEAHTDTSGTEEFNMDLASSRGENVKDFLISIGISSDIIKMNILGESDPILNTGDGVKEPENRQVLIIAN